MTTKLEGFGAGLRAQHYREVLADDAKRLDWFEAITEHYLEPGGQPRDTLRRVRERRPVTLHGVSMSLGSTDPIDRAYVRAVRDLAREIEPALISDHLGWSSLAGQHVHDLWPLPRTEESLAHVEARVLEAQELLGRSLVIENIAAYMAFESSQIAECDFLAELCRRTDCKLLVDLNNLYLCERNLGVDAAEWLRAIPVGAVAQIHLGGHSEVGAHLLDTHDTPVADDVWSLYRIAVARFGAVPTMVEWDEQIPPYAVLCDEVDKARRIAAEVL